ncbi:YIEGIA domain-containing protein [Desulfosporosinus sp.]|uniref:YIEGIA domain-containing protein n=1 Tax=Desulfosporosinus sp. TaxID=157907 RepID=UPI000E920451|nr:YIEGIA domain-containing protein [Desulfosporosinus sp.]MBC2723470.1 YIEGIA domain-containing protein [Desulfosporosinus sp.]MBC2725297.1 YIEGIA domain-containing protein [Desulfosporosinus sp.]HBV85629.1 YIEGIA protein [Desulfosporosinus sp.]
MPNNNDLISPEVLTLIITATIIGTLSRILTIKLDYRQYPNYPNGYLIHAVTGGLAASIGAFIIPAVVAKQFTAVTFLALAIQHFREVRKIERESLSDLEGEEYTKRGKAYIDGISKIFEARNYIAFLVALVTGITIQLLQSLTTVSMLIEVGCGSVAGLIVFYILKLFTKRQKISDIATVTEGKIEITDSSLYVNGMFISHLMGREEAKKWFIEDGLAAVINPNHKHFQIPLLNKGQRQAIIFEVTRRIGQRKIYSVQEINSGKLIIALVPVIKNFNLFKETILLTPLLETVKKNPELLRKNKGV